MFLRCFWPRCPPLSPRRRRPPSRARRPRTDYNAGGLPRTPTYGTVEGQPIDTRVPEKKADTRQFPQQTRAPYHHATDFKVTVLTNQLHAAWASALLPDGNLLVTERLPGAFRIVGKDGAVGAADGAGRPACLHAHDRPAGCGAGSGLRQQPHHLFHLLRISRQDRLQHRHRARRAGRKRRRHPRREGAAQDLALRAQRPDPGGGHQDRRAHRHRRRRLSLCHHRRPRQCRPASLAGGAVSRHPSGQGDPHHQGRRAGAGQSLHRPAGRAAGNLGDRLAQSRKAWPLRPMAACTRSSMARAAATNST